MKPRTEITRRERDVLIALCRPAIRAESFTEPASIREIAAALDITDAAVKQHLIHLYDKFGIFEGDERRRLRLANEVLDSGLLSRTDLGAPPGDAAASGPGAEELAAGRTAAAQRNWRLAYEHLHRADATPGSLAAADLELLGEAAVWTGRHDESIAARQRAYSLHVAEGNERRAALVALALVVNYKVRVNAAMASGWFAKAKRHLEGIPPDIEHGYLAATEALFALFAGRLDAALERAQAALQIAQRHGDADLRALAQSCAGYALAQLGRMDEATPLFDEAMASATGGELGPLATGVVYCRTICACLDSFDYRRALEWSEAVERVAADACTAGFPGDCRAHRASIFVTRGQWQRGEEEARTACAETERFDLEHTALAHYEIGQIKLRRGEFADAAAAFKRSLELGTAPQPGLALLYLAQGDAAAAMSSIRAALELAADGFRRARLLPAQAEIALSAGDTATAQAAADEMQRVAAAHPSAVLRAAAEGALGIAALMIGDAAAAVAHLRRSCSLWLENEAPYEAARARLHLAAALQALDDDNSRVMELELALASFERLGAKPDAECAARLLKG